MKRFDLLEEQESKIVKEKKKVEGKRIQLSLIRVIIVAVVIIVALCVVLFGNHGKNNTTANTSKSYEVEVDGVTYSADTIEELNDMVGFDVSYLFNNSDTKKKETKVKAKLYENDELANIETENGTYKFGVTDAKLMKRTANQGGETMYQITYIIENVDFDSGSGEGVSLFPEDLKVTDSDGDTCTMLSEYYDDEAENEYDLTPTGKKTEKKAVYKAKNIDSNYIDVYFIDRGVTCRINVSNVKEFAEANKKQQIKMGDTVKISDKSGEMEITVDAARIDNTFAYEPLDKINVLLIDFDINNISYDQYSDGMGIDCFSLANIINVKDDRGYRLSVYDTFSKSGDGKYSFYDTVKTGSKGKVAIQYEVSKGCKSITIDFLNGTTVEIEL